MTATATFNISRDDFPGDDPSVVHNNTGGEPILLLFGQSDNNSGAPTAITWDGSAGTLIQRQDTSEEGAGAYYRASPTEGSAIGAAAFNSNPYGSFFVLNVEEMTGIVQSGKTTGATSPGSITLGSCVAGNIMIVVSGMHRGNFGETIDFAITSPNTTELDKGGANGGYEGVFWLPTNTGDTTFSFTYNTAAISGYALVAMEVEGAFVAGGTKRRNPFFFSLAGLAIPAGLIVNGVARVS